MLSIKVKAIISAIIIIVTLIWFFSPQDKAQEVLPKGNTLYVQSNLAGECRAIITPILDGVSSASSEVPCKILRSKK